MDWHIVWVWVTFFLVACPTFNPTLAFDNQEMDGAQGRADWMLQSQLANSVPRIGRRSFSSLAKNRGEGFRFFGGDLPRGVAAAAAYGYGDGKENALMPSAASKNWRGFWGPTYGGGGYPGNEAEDDLLNNSDESVVGSSSEKKFREKRIPEIVPDVAKRQGMASAILPTTTGDSSLPSGPNPNSFNLGDDQYWNEFLNGARKSVLDKLSKFSLLNEAEEDIAAVAEDVATDDENDPIPSSPPLTRSQIHLRLLQKARRFYK